MQCRPGCAACCIAPSINIPLPGMPQGKPAGVACANLIPETGFCRIWESDSYPEPCRQFRAMPEHCGESRQQALRLIGLLESETAP
ncbi:YkgJ family cysteine cluster protein [Marinobacterium jannaschii]|uniref:YkgJ family cysteine cluster protein n=1 Tax=Marinobacterium jannaschii TaxID=64970 RepID=UPI00048831D8|nr:YkgJ family cysteine cluster protein [Marinobacterium jannaschii]